MLIAGTIPASVAVCAGEAEPTVRKRAGGLAHELALPLVDPDLPAPADRFTFLLTVTSRRLELREATGRGRPLYVDFCGGTVGYRRRAAGSRRQPLARAIGICGEPPRVFDATAGLGRDSFLLACLGCQVTVVERSPILGVLLRDGLDRAATSLDPKLAAIAGRMSLTFGDARRILADVPNDATPDVVYLDPMYPPKTKSALAKKEMRICRRLVGDDPDAGELLGVARTVARRRVVVKRYRHAPPLAPDVTTEYRGRVVRYDVYSF
jgi:16S rRNA (guanine1516-N2)-methyltransferase